MSLTDREVSSRQQPLTPCRLLLIRSVIGAVALAVLCLVEWLVALGPSPSLVVGLLAVAVGLGPGALGGLVSGAWLMVLARRSPRTAGFLDISVGLLIGMWLTDELGVLARLGTKDHRLALAAIAGSMVASLIVALLLVLTRIRDANASGVRVARGTWLSRVEALVMIGVAIGCAVVDAIVEPDAYPQAHVVLRAVSWLAVVALLTRSRIVTWCLRRYWSRLMGVLLAAAIAPHLILARGEVVVLEELFGRSFSSSSVALWRYLGDMDRDGYSSLLGGGDCDAWNASVHPGAPEIPGNGVDDNCLRGDLVAVASEFEASVPEKDDAPVETSVLLITIDTLAAERMSLYGAHRQTTPHLDRWARDALVFERAYTSGGWTSLAIPSMLYGVYPRRLRWTRLFETNKWRLLRAPVEGQLQPGERSRMMFALPVEEPRSPLPLCLQRRGVATGAVLNDRQSEFFDARVFRVPGFDRYRDMDALRMSNRTDGATTDAALKMLSKLPRTKPFFLWVHYFGPHLPDEEHAGIPNYGPEVVDRYDHEIAYADREVMRLIDRVEERSKSFPLAVIVAADHGEALSLRGRGHGRQTRESAIHIPLVVKAPGLQPGRVSTMASLVDVAPTILSITGTSCGHRMDGVDLRMLAGDATPDDRVVLMETWQFDAKGHRVLDYLLAMDGSHALIRYQLTEAITLRSQDPVVEATRKNFIDEVEYGHLQDVMEQYVEEAGVLRLFD